MTMPLEHIRVLDFTTWQNGAYATALLADLGAEVIKVEPPEGEGARGSVSKSRGDDFSSYFQAHNRGKKSITVDLRRPEGKEVIFRLVPHVDVVTENYRIGVMDNLGLGYDVLSKLNPRLIFATNSAFGPRGPWAEWRGLDSCFQAVGGAMIHQGGGPGSTPEAIALPAGDQVGAIVFSYSILAALVARSETGLGQKVDTSGLGAQFLLQSWRITDTLRRGYHWPIPHGRITPDPCWHYYRDSQGRWFLVCLMAHMGWGKFCKAIWREDLANVEEYQTVRGRANHRDVVEPLLSEIFATKSREEWVSRLQECGIPAAPIHEYGELAEVPQVLANDYVVTVNDPHVGPMRTTGVAMDFSATAAQVRRGAPLLSEHTDEVLMKLGGYTPEELVNLRAQGAV